MTAFSRGAGVFGKCTEELKTKVPVEIHELAARRARELGMTTSEWLRDVALIALLGEDTVLSLYQDRVRSVASAGRAGGDK